MKRIRFVLIVGLLLSACAAIGSGSDVPPATENLGTVLPHIPVVPPEESIHKFKVEPGFEVQLVAAEPNVADPVDAGWDENGRLFVCELWNYPGVPKKGEKLGRIRLLTSSRRDGVYDHSTVFADDLRWPSSAICWDGGIFVISNPDIWYLKDSKGDGKADIKKKVFTGLQGETYEVANSLRWGPDNKIYVCGSYAGGKLRPVDAKTEPAHSRDFRFDPRTGVCESVSGGGEWGAGFNDWGDRFNCDATDLCYHTLLPDADLKRNPYLAVPDTRENSAGEWAHVYPISPAEPWKAVRQQFWQKWVGTSSDFNPGRFPPNELAPHGFATSACGLTIYRGSLFPADYLNDEFIAEPANNLVVRLHLSEDGLHARSARVESNQQSEFLSSADNRFRPVNFANGPDGALYIISMYREIIEDETAIPADILGHYDLYSGRDLGRIYRVVPKGVVPSPLPSLGASSTAELVKLLSSRDVWNRETGQRLLYQRQDTAAVPELKKLLDSGATPQTKIHALWTLKGLSALDDQTLASAMTSEHSHVREQALQIFRELPETSAQLQSALLPLADDPSERVRFQAAFALGRVADPGALEALARIARRDAANRWTPVAIAAAVPDRAGKLFSLLAVDGSFVKSSGSEMLLGLLAEVIGARHDSDEVAQFLADASSPALADGGGGPLAVLRQLSAGLARGGSSLPEQLNNPAVAAHRDALIGLLQEAASRAADPSADESERVGAVQLLSFAPYESVRKPLLALLDAREPIRIQLEAVRAVAAHADDEVAGDLVANWKHFGPAVQPDVIKSLFRRSERLPKLLDAIETKLIRPADLTPQQRNQLLNDSSQTIRDRAGRVLTPPENADKQALIDRYRTNLLKLVGDVERGKLAFQNTCAVCHRPEHGTRPGPNLAILEDRTPGTLLISILDPNREVKPSFVSFLLVTKDNQTLSGVIDNETTNSVTVRYPGGGEEVVLRSNIRQIRSTGLSLMPEGLEGSLDYQKMADLLAYLRVMKD